MHIGYPVMAIMAITACSGVPRSQQASAVNASAANATPASPPSALDAQIEQRMRDAGLVGIGAAIIVDRRLVWTRGYGFADRQRAVPFTPDTITDRAAIYERTYHFGGDSPEPLGAFLESYFVPGGKHHARENFLNVQPGTHREYSNIAVALAGYIVERAVGEPLNAYTRKHILAPLRMAHSGWFLSEVDPAKHAMLYVKASGIASPIQRYGGTTYPDGGVRTSVADLSKFFIALLSEGEYQGIRILDRVLAREMLRFQFTESNKPDNVSLAETNSGLFWQSKFDVTRMGHGGTDPGLKTDMLADLSGQIGVILFSNTTLDQQALRAYLQIFELLWNQAVAWKGAAR